MYTYARRGQGGGDKTDPCGQRGVHGHAPPPAMPRARAAPVVAPAPAAARGRHHEGGVVGLPHGLGARRQPRILRRVACITARPPAAACIAAVVVRIMVRAPRPAAAAAAGIDHCAPGRA